MANRLILGEFGGDYVLRVSRPSRNVLDPNLARKHLAFDSRWPENMNILQAASVPLPPAASNPPRLDIAHPANYPTAPVGFAWTEFGGHVYQLDAGRTAISSMNTNLSMIMTRSQMRVGWSTYFTTRPELTVHYVILRNANG